MPYIANPLEGIPLVNTFITDQSLLGTTPATDDVLIIYDQSATALKQLTIAELQASVLVAPAFTGVPTAPTANAGTNTTQLATTAFVTTATTALNTIDEMTDTTISSVGANEVLKWSGSAWINQTLAEANILPVAGPTFTGVLTVGSAVLSEADLEQIDDLTAGTAVASKALVVDSNKDIGTLRNLTIDGTFSDGNYTFDTSGNVSGLGTIGSGAINNQFIVGEAPQSGGGDDQVSISIIARLQNPKSRCSQLDRDIFVYSFSLNPEDHQPSGTCNFSRIESSKILLDSAGTISNIYAVNYNVLRIMSGMGGLAYAI